MRFIVIDTADARGSAALFQSNELIGLESHSNEEDYSSWLLPAVHRILQPSGLSLSQLDGYAVCAGPGSFTGLRVGLTTVKAWSEIYSRPIAGVSRLEALTANAPSAPEISEPFVAASFDARRGQLFAALYKRSAGRFELVGEESVIAPAEFVRMVFRANSGQKVRWRAADPSLLQSIPDWQSGLASGHVLEPIQAHFADRIGWIALRKFKAGEVTDAISLDANYVRRSDAELFWKDHGSAVTP